MANMLSSAQMRSWRREVIERLSLGAGLAVIFSSLVVTLAIAPAYIETRADARAREAELKALAAPDSAAAAKRTDEETLNKARKRLAALEKYGSGGAVAEAIQHALELKPKGVHITSLRYDAGVSGTLTITGSLADDASLKGYADALKKSGAFKDVTVPLSSLAHIGKEFSLTVTGSF